MAAPKVTRFKRVSQAALENYRVMRSEGKLAVVSGHRRRPTRGATGAGMNLCCSGVIGARPRRAGSGSGSLPAAAGAGRRCQKRPKW